MNKHKELRELLTIMFGSCPLTDEFIDNEYETACMGIFAEVNCASYIKNELEIPYCDEYVGLMLEAGIDPNQKVDLNYQDGIDHPKDFV
jgi:hypothetical protein